MCIHIKGKFYTSISSTHATLAETSYVVLAMMTLSFTTGSNSMKQTVWCREHLLRPQTLTLAWRVLNERNIEVCQKRSLVYVSKIRRGAIFAVTMLEQAK